MAEPDPLSNATNITDHGETVFTRNCGFNGVLKTDGPVRIYGVFEGEVETSGPLIVGKAARVTAAITAHDVGVAGTVLGNINALGRVQIFSGGRVYGDVVARALKIDDGAVFSGHSILREDQSSPYLTQSINGRIERPHPSPLP